jgi:hypothetical protein
MCSGTVEFLTLSYPEGLTQVRELPNLTQTPFDRKCKESEIPASWAATGRACSSNGWLMKSIAAFCWFYVSLAHAQPWPSKLVKLAAPFGAGSVLDTMMRAMQNELSAALASRSMNRPGAGGTVGTAAVAKGPADGYTLLIAANSHNINGSVYSNLAYDPQKDFTAVASVGITGYIMMVPSPAKNIGEFITLAKAKPGSFILPRAWQRDASVDGVPGTWQASTCCMCRIRARATRCSK